jgi:hypothetical protein
MQRGFSHAFDELLEPSEVARNQTPRAKEGQQ